ncbi:MAG: hypothetical protein IKN66_02865 [Ruminococcus sp.]|nr:hypothetical protein [Ruminococcus sp.]
MSRRYELTLENGTVLHVKPPTVRQFYKGLKAAATDAELFRAIAEICSGNDENIDISEEYVIDNFTVDDLHGFFRGFTGWVMSERDKNPN